MNWKIIVEKRAAVKNALAVGVDIAKKWHVAQISLPDGSSTKPLRFYNDLEGFQRLISFIEHHQARAGCQNVIVGYESTGHYGLNLAHWLNERGFQLVQVNPAHVRRSRDMGDNNPGSSDAKSAWRIADLIRQGVYNRVILPTGDYARLRELVVLRAQLVEERTVQLNRLQVALDRLFPEFTDVFKDVNGKTARYILKHYPTPADILRKSARYLVGRLRRKCHKSLSLAKIEKLQEKARNTVGIKEAAILISAELVYCLGAVEALNERLAVIEDGLAEIVKGIPAGKYMMSIPGIGVITTAIILGETGGLHNYPRSSAVLKLAGYNLYVVQSGNYTGQHRISKRGRTLLRHALFLAAIRVIRYNGQFKSFYQRLVERGKPRVKAAVAVACRLMRVMFALVRDERVYCDSWSWAGQVK